MRFNPRARLDRSQVQVRRGGGGSRGGGFPIPMGTGGKVGGGIGGIILLIIVLVLGGGVGGLGGDGGSGGLGDALAPRSETGAVSSSELTECRTGEDANANPDCARLAVVNSIQSFWREALPQQAGRDYVMADTVMFSGSVEHRMRPGVLRHRPVLLPCP